MTDFRSLCARMANELDYLRQLLADDRREIHALAAEARAALAQPPADGEVAELVAQLRVIGNDYGVRHSADCRRAADLLERQQWQLIKDAPRDGTEIWASDFDAIEIVHWQGRARFDVDSEGEWITREGDYLFPACWQPLPDHPPLPSEEEQ